MLQSTTQLAQANKANTVQDSSDMESLKATEAENLGATLST